MNIYINQKVYYFSALILAFTSPLHKMPAIILTIVLTILWFIDKSFLDNLKSIRDNKILLSILLFLSYMSFTLLWSSDLTIGLNFLRLYSYWILIFVFATRLHKEQIPTIVSAFLLGMLLSEIGSYGAFFEFWKFGFATKGNLSPFMPYIDYSLFLAFSASLLLSRIIAKDTLLNMKIIYFVFFLLAAGNMFLSPGRVGQVAFIFSVFIVWFVHYRISLKTLSLAFISILVIFGVALSISDMFVTRIGELKSDITMISNLNFDGSIGTRVAYHMVGFELFKINPLFGVGLGSSLESVRDFLKYTTLPFSDFVKQFMSTYYLHSQYLMIVVESGIFGLVLIFNIFIQIIRTISINNDIKELGLIFCCIVLCGFITEPILFHRYIIGFFVLFVSLIAVYANKFREE